MHELAPLIYDLAVMLGIAGAVALLFQRIRQPVILGYLVAGIIIGPHTPPYALVTDIDNIQTLSELGVIFLMFSLGLEFSFEKLISVGFSASFTCVIEVVFMILLGWLTGHLLGWTFYNALFLGAALSISSTTIIIKAIEELGLKTKRFAELIFAVLIIEDLLAMLLLAALSSLVLSNDHLAMDLLSTSSKLILVVMSWFLMGYFLIPPLFQKSAKYINQETLTVISVALCLVLVTIAAQFHYSSALGAFIMGSILAETIVIHRILKLIKPIRDIFAAVFFISIGMLMDPIVIIQYWPLVILLSLITLVGKIASTSLGAVLTGQSLDTAVCMGFSMAQIGELSFIIIAMGSSLNVINNKLYPLIVAVSIVTTFTTPYLIRLSRPTSDLLESKLPERTKFFLESYSAWMCKVLAFSQKKSFFSKVALRLLINGLLVAILFSVVDYIADRYLPSTLAQSWYVNILLLLISLVIASPFIWGMLFSYKKIKLSNETRALIDPVIIVVWLLSLSEITLLGTLYFHTLTNMMIFIIIAIVFMIIAYRHLERSYHWFEHQLIKNLRKKRGND